MDESDDPHSNNSIPDPKFIANWMRIKKLGCDGIIQTEDGGNFHVHFILLCPVSGFLRALYLNGINTVHDGPLRVLIRGIKMDIMEKILQFVYCQEIGPSSEQVTELLFAADYFQMDSLVAYCSNLMLGSLSDDNCVLFFKTALKLEHLKLVPMLERYFLLHFGDIMSRDINSIVDWPLQIMLNILKQDSLNTSEDIVWLVISTWMQYDISKRAEHLPSLLCCVRLLLLDNGFVFNNILCNPITQTVLPLQGLENCSFAIGCQQNLMSALQKLSYEPLSFGTRGPKEVVFLIRDCDMRSRQEEGCFIYEMYDYQFDTYRLVAKEGMDHLPSRICVIGRKIYLYLSRENLISIFDVIDRTWDWLPPFNAIGCDPEMVSLNGKLYALGGYGEDLELSLEVYDEDEEDWIPLEPMSTQHEGMAVADSDYIYVSGGHALEGQPDEYFEDIERYDPKTDTWSYINRPNLLRSGMTLVVYRNELYAIGGRTPHVGETTVVEKYDSKNDSWQRLCDTPYPLYAATALVIDDVLIYSTDFHGDGKRPALFFEVSTGHWKPVTLLDRPWVRMLQTCVDFLPHQVCVVRDTAVISELRKEKWPMESGGSVLHSTTEGVISGAFSAY